MGKKGYNWRSRQVVETQIDNSATKEINVDFGKQEYGGYDQCNAQILPSDKRKTKVIRKNLVTKRILSKTQRKKLEKIVDRKKKKANRASLLESLASVQVSEAELKQLTSITTVQTKGTKRFKEDAEQKLNLNEVKTDAECQENRKVSSVAGSRKRRILALQDSERKPKELKVDPNVVGFDDSGSSESENSESENSESEMSADEPDIPEIKEDEVVEAPIVEAVVMPEIKEKTPTENKIVKSTTNEKQCLISKKSAVFVEVSRDPEIQIARLKLPILGEEQIVMECINENQIVILAGETGSGKTTQVPQFLYEAGYAKDKMIGVTEPRRVAAISMSQRVGREMNLSSREVSYLIRFEGNTTNDTKIKFMTDGVLLKELQTDFTLSKYSVIILDEAHERSVFTDILIGLLSRIVPLRNKKNNPLKLIIMSATLRIEDFTSNSRLFKKPPPVIKVESRQYPVTIHFNKRTSDNYIGEALKKTIKIHATLPQGGILIFVTGQQEVNTLVKKLRNAFPYSNIHNATKKVETATNNEDIDVDSDDDVNLEMNMKRAIRNAKKAALKKSQIATLPKIDLDNYQLPGDDADADLHEDSDALDSENEDDELNLKGLTNTQPLWVIPLYSLLPSHKQAKVFQSPPEGTRLCIVSTNVAETSLTIPNVKYVVDTGRQKTRLYDKVTGVSAFVVTYCSKAAANQRAGRAGRTGPGHCYRLYSSAVYNDQFEDFSVPEIQKKPVDDLMLQMKCMGIDKVVNFPFPSAPDLLQLKHAERRLMLLGALEIPNKLNFSSEDIEFTSKVTPLGHAISAFPVAPRFGKMLALSHQQDLLPYTICMVAALSVQEVLLEVSLDNENSKRSKWALKRRSWVGVGNSLYLGDPMVLMRAVGASEYSATMGNLEQFCEQNGLRPKAISEIRKLRVQLTNEINLNMPELNLFVDPQMPPPSDLQSKLLRQILLSGMGDQVAKKYPESEIKQSEDKKKFKYAYQCSEMEEPVFMHSCSVLRKQQPEWVIYQEVYEIQNGDSTKMFIRGITAIEPEWLPKYVPRLCNLGDPLSDPPPRFCQNTGKVYCHVSGSFGRVAWELPIIEVEYPNNVECYKWFSKFLLEGEVCIKLAKYKSSLLSTPSIMIKSWAKLHKRTDVILKTLANRSVCNRAKLLEIWEHEPEYLLSAYLQWLPESAHNEVSLLWPPK